MMIDGRAWRDLRMLAIEMIRRETLRFCVMDTDMLRRKVERNKARKPQAVMEKKEIPDFFE